MRLLALREVAVKWTSKPLQAGLFAKFVRGVNQAIKARGGRMQLWESLPVGHLLVLLPVLLVPQIKHCSHQNPFLQREGRPRERPGLTAQASAARKAQRKGQVPVRWPLRGPVPLQRPLLPRRGLIPLHLPLLLQLAFLIHNDQFTSLCI